MTDPVRSIRIGTLVSGNAPDPAAIIRKIIPHGFESIEVTFWQKMDKDLPALAAQVKEAIGDHDVTTTVLGMFGNPLEDGDGDRHVLESLKKLIDHAHLFGATTVAAFTGRIRNKPIEASLPRFKQVWSELAKRAADKGVRIAFENCSMGGNWETGDFNIAHTPDAWELMFNELPDDNVGLEWEPCHQVLYLIDPLPQIRQWASKIFHVHGKDANIQWDVVRQHGVYGKVPFAFQRTPGFGDTNWATVISELRRMNWSGTIDIEGYHDSVYRGELEMTGQVYSLNYLKHCRGGPYVANP